MKAKPILVGAVALANVAALGHHAVALAIDPAGVAALDLVPYTATLSSSAAFTVALAVDACEPAPICLEVPPGWSIETRPRDD